MEQKILCKYGCKNEAKFQLKNGNWICSSSPNKCPEILRKNSEKNKLALKDGRIPGWSRLHKQGKLSSWNKGLTKGTDERVKKNGESVSKVLKGASKPKPSIETRKKLSIARKKYLKEHADDTSWRLGNQMSYLEKHFLGALKLNRYFDKFEIVREKCFYPYYADFAFENAKVVVELDGQQHIQRDRKERDIKKDQLIVSQGWRVIRFASSQVYSNIKDVLKELDEFIGDDFIKSKTSEIITEADKKRILKQRQYENDCKKYNTTDKKEIRLLKFKEFYKNRHLINIQKINEKEFLNNLNNNLIKQIKLLKVINSNINFEKRGWQNQVAEILQIRMNKVTLWMRKNLYDFWINNCKIRKSTIKKKDTNLSIYFKN